MVKTYQGYFLEDGRFVPDGMMVKLPARRRAIVNILENEVVEERIGVQDNYLFQDKLDKIKMILADAASNEHDTLTDDDWDEMLSLRAQSNSGFSRAVEV